MNIETELNLSLAPELAVQLLKHPLLTESKPVCQRVVHTYYDTPDQRLRRERVIAGYRKDGSAWVPSVGRLGLPDARPGVNGEKKNAGALGDHDFSRVADGSLRPLLESVRDDLKPAFTTRFTRRAWTLEPRDGVRIDLALDRGWIEAAGRRQAICEVGLELRSGGVADLFSVAGELQTELQLHPEVASKFQRGYHVLADESWHPVKALPIATDGGMTTIAAFRTVALACLHHLQSNEQGLRENDNPEFVHQARVAIRRLRSAIRVWKPRLPQDFVARFDPQWQALARQLGEARNWDVFTGETLPSVLAAFPESGVAARLSHYAAARCVSSREAARALLKSVDYSRLLLEFTAAVLALPEGRAHRLEAFAPRRLEKRAQQVRQLAEEALSGDAASRHRLRVAYKRLRYALEFFAPLFPGAALRDYHVAASGLQEMLGELNDLAVAMDLTAEALPDEHGEAIRCWLEGQSERRLPELGALVGAFREQAAPWRTP